MESNRAKARPTASPERFLVAAAAGARAAGDVGLSADFGAGMPPNRDATAALDTGSSRLCASMSLPQNAPPGKLLHVCSSRLHRAPHNTLHNAAAFLHGARRTAETHSSVHVLPVLALLPNTGTALCRSVLIVSHLAVLQHRNPDTHVHTCRGHRTLSSECSTAQLRYFGSCEASKAQLRHQRVLIRQVIQCDLSRRCIHHCISGCCCNAQHCTAHTLQPSFQSSFRILLSLAGLLFLKPVTLTTTILPGKQQSHAAQ